VLMEKPKLAAAPTLTPEKARECHTLTGIGRAMLACRFAPGGRHLLAGGMLPDVVQYELARDGDRTQWAKPGKTLRLAGHKSWVAALACSPDGKRSYSADHAGLILAWDFPAKDAGQKPVWTREGHQGWVRAAAVSPDGQLLATAGNDQMVRVWS